jgi:Tol biopolymer transport system component
VTLVRRKRLLVVGALLAGLVVCTAGANAGSAQTTALRGTIALTGHDGNGAQVYLLHLASGELSPLTSGPASHVAYDWSPGGTHLLVNETGPGRLGLYSVPLDGSPEVHLARHFVWGDALWSPDGRRIAFVVPDHRGNRGLLYVVDADGSHKRLLASNVFIGTSFFTGSFSWSPGGARIVFARQGGLFTVSTVGRPVVRWIRLRSHVRHPAVAWQPVWSPDGSSIAFTAADSANSLGRIFVMRRNGSQVRPLPGGHGPVWSPDSSRIAFRNNGYWVARPDGTHVNGVLGSWSGITFSPDSTKLAYVGGQGHVGNGDVFVVDADGSKPVRVLHVHSLDFDLPLWRSGSATTEAG